MKIAYFCGESSKEEILGRIYAHEAGVSFTQLLTAFDKLTVPEVGRVNQSAQLFYSKAENIHIYGDEDYDHSLKSISATMSDLDEKFGQFDMVYVDYLQLMQDPAECKGDTLQSITKNINGLKKLAGTYRVAMVVMSQLTQEAGKNSIGNGRQKQVTRLRMEDNRGGGAINNCAHFVTFLQRDTEDQELFNNGDCLFVPTFWYSDKTRLQKAIKTVIGFDGTTAEYREINLAKYNQWKEAFLHRKANPITRSDDPPPLGCLL